MEAKKTKFNYEIIEKYEAGISLLGFEVKSIKQGNGSIDESYITEENGEMFLVGAYIPPYQPKNTPNDYKPDRARKILLKKEEIKKLKEKSKSEGLTIVPISLYNKGRNIKLEMALVRGKRKFDKRQTIKRRDLEREMGRRLK